MITSFKKVVWGHSLTTWTRRGVGEGVSGKSMEGRSHDKWYTYSL